ncbi:MAG: S9 family peptidase [Planctomycetes bacterium]|nr:S9 family peptidase [Planctomycetota bacterium]
MNKKIHTFSAPAVAAVLLGLNACEVAQPRPRKPDTGVPEMEPADFYETTAISSLAISPDGTKVIYSSDKSGIQNVYLQKLGDPPGSETALTQSVSSANLAVDFFPDGARILYTADQGGNELNHLYVREADGASRDLTPGDKAKASFAGWAVDGNSFFVMTNERDPKHNDVYRYSADAKRNYERQLLFENNETMNVAAVSPSGQWVALAKLNSNADSDLYLWDAQAPEAGLMLITSHKTDAVHDAAGFSHDSSKLYYITNLDSEYEYVCEYAISGGTSRKLYQADWDITHFESSRDGRRRAIIQNADARAGLSVFEDGKAVELPPVPSGQIRSFRFSDDGRKIAFIASGDRDPSNVVVMDLAAKKSEYLTNSLSQRMRREWLARAETIRYKSFDGLEIPAILYKPFGATKEWKAPAIVLVHGGPGGQSLVQYSADIQFLVNHGYAVLAVNNRGSSGYGKKFYHMDDRRHGDVDLKDCVWARRHLESLDWVDGARVAIMGGSYGGYMVAAALAFEPDAFNCGIDLFGVTNWLRTLKSIPAWWEAQRKSLYDEIGDPSTPAGEEALRKKSPLFYANQIRKPLFVIQGKNDPRVLEAESRELADAVRANGVPVEYVTFDDEGHGFRNKKNQIHAAAQYLQFLEAHLK